MPMTRNLFILFVFYANAVLVLPVFAESTPTSDRETSTVEQARDEQPDSAATVDKQLEAGTSAVINKVLQKLKAKGLVDEINIEAALDEMDKGVGSDHILTRINATDALGDDIVSVIVPILAITLIFGTPLIIVALISFNNYRRRKLLHDSVNKLIEQGRDIPPQLFDYFEGTGNTDNNFNKGVTLLAVGVGVVISLSLLINIAVGSLGLILLFLGLAHLVIWWVEKGKASDH